MTTARLAATGVALIWLVTGAVLLFNIGRVPLRLINSMRARQVEEAAVVPAYWRGWGAVLVAAGLALLVYSFSR